MFTHQRAAQGKRPAHIFLPGAGIELLLGRAVAYSLQQATVEWQRYPGQLTLQCPGQQQHLIITPLTQPLVVQRYRQDNLWPAIIAIMIQQQLCQRLYHGGNQLQPGLIFHHLQNSVDRVLVEKWCQTTIEWHWLAQTTPTKTGISNGQTAAWAEADRHRAQCQAAMAKRLIESAQTTTENALYSNDLSDF